MALTVDVAGKSDVGCVRANNEDNFGYDTRYGIYVVCDGMGGQAAGEVASKIAVETVLKYFREAGAAQRYPAFGEQAENVSERANALGSALQLANEVVYSSAAQHVTRLGMGSTAVAVLVGTDNFYSVGNVGDSRAYLVRDGAIEQLTQDHSLVMEQVRRGLITMEEANASEMQNIIMRALGAEEKLQPDLEDRMARPGDTLVLCSDGLTRELTDDEICATVTREQDVSRACDALISAARQAGGHDNITVLLVRFVEKSWFKGLIGGGSPKWQNSI